MNDLIEILCIGHSPSFQLDLRQVISHCNFVKPNKTVRRTIYNMNIAVQAFLVQ